MSFLLNTALVASIIVSLAFLPVRADDMYVWAEESGGDVIFHHQGSIDLTDFPPGSESISAPALAPDRGIYANGIGGSSNSTDFFDAVLPVDSSRPFGTSSTNTSGSVAGDILILSLMGVGVPLGYVSQTPISGSLTFASTDFDTLEVVPTPGTFDTTVGDNTIHLFTMPPIAPPPTTTPVPATVDNSVLKLALQSNIKKLSEKARKLKKKGKKAKAKKLKRKIKKLKVQLAAPG